MLLWTWFVGRVGLGPSDAGSGWVGSEIMDPRPCLGECSETVFFLSSTFIASTKEVMFLLLYVCLRVDELRFFFLDRKDL